MDPTETFLRFVNAMCDDDTETAMEAINDLSEWYLKDGFHAKFPGSEIDVPYAFVHNMVVHMQCAYERFVDAS